LDRTHPQHPHSDARSTASRALAAVPAPAAQTLLGLQALIGDQSRIPLDVEWIAKQLLDGMPIAWAADRIERDVLVLEDAGHVVTWAQDGREWLALPRRGHAAPRPAQAHSVGFSEPPFSSAWEREREGEKERARGSARARAWERMDAETRESAAHWASEYSEIVPQRPKRPARLDAPPLGCPDHPNGTMQECGKCGTAAERRKTFLAGERYLDDMVRYEEAKQQQWEDVDRAEF
jgi:hypothetical protein